MHIYLAIFWFIVGVVVNVYWETLEQHRFVPVSREIVTFACFVLFSYNLIRWRLARSYARSQEELPTLPPRPRVEKSDEYNAEFDFSKKNDQSPRPPPT